MNFAMKNVIKNGGINKMRECHKNVYMVWVKREYDSFPIEPFYTKEKADKKAEELNIKYNTNKYYVASTSMGYGITV